ncbi:MFS transporter [Candidatus Thorarchaeota archaeon]|nr:MAG: MFS transporter [Candidatus Thorarchaeota archaeon]
MTEQETTERRRLPSRAYAVGSLAMFAQGLYSPFLNSYMVDLGASLSEIGAFRSMGNVAPTILQPVWGSVSDKTGHTKAFVAFGTVSGLFTVFLFLFAATPLDMIVLYGIQSILLSIQIPTWLSLVGSLIDEENRGIELGKLGMATNIMSLLATLFSGFIAAFPILVPFLRASLGWLGSILFPSVEVWKQVYYLPFYLTAITGIIASLLSIGIQTRNDSSGVPREFPPVLRLLSEPSEFRKLCFVATFFSFAMSMAWPFWIIVQRQWLNNTLLEIAIASAIMTLTTVIFTIPLGRFSDRVGRKPLIFLGRFTLFVVPIMYAFAFTTISIYVANAIAGFSVAATTNANTAYIYDIAPAEERGAHLSVYNTFTGIVMLLGSLVAGILGDFIAISIGVYLAVFTMLVVSGLLRFISSFLYLLLDEPREYSSDVWTEIRAFFLGRQVNRGL